MEHLGSNGDTVHDHYFELSGDKTLNNNPLRQADCDVCMKPFKVEKNVSDAIPYSSQDVQDILEDASTKHFCTTVIKISVATKKGEYLSCSRK